LRTLTVCLKFKTLKLCLKIAEKSALKECAT